MAPRIRPADDHELDDDARALLATVDTRGTSASNVWRTLIKNKGLFRRFSPFGGKLMNGVLSPRTRELAVLRVAHRCRCAYQWAYHVEIASAAGLEEADIARVGTGRIDAAEWSALDAAVLTAVDELHDGATVTDPTWSALRAELDEPALIELLMLIGHFHLVAFVVNGAKVELEWQPEGLKALR